MYSLSISPEGKLNEFIGGSVHNLYPDIIFLKLIRSTDSHIHHYKISHDEINDLELDPTNDYRIISAVKCFLIDIEHKIYILFINNKLKQIFDSLYNYLSAVDLKLLYKSENFSTKTYQTFVFTGSDGVNWIEKEFCNKFISNLFTCDEEIIHNFSKINEVSMIKTKFIKFHYQIDRIGGYFLTDNGDLYEINNQPLLIKSNVLDFYFIKKSNNSEYSELLYLSEYSLYFYHSGQKMEYLLSGNIDVSKVFVKTTCHHSIIFLIDSDGNLYYDVLRVSDFFKGTQTFKKINFKKFPCDIPQRYTEVCFFFNYKIAICYINFSIMTDTGLCYTYRCNPEEFENIFVYPLNSNVCQFEPGSSLYGFIPKKQIKLAT